LSVPAAEALKRAAEILNRKGFRIIIYDAYRPRKAVEFFMRWAADADMAGDSSFYPGLTKLQILKNGYIAAKSSHTRGSAVDLGLCDTKGCELDMGSPFDLFNAISHHGAVVPAEAEERRNILLDAMTSSGFIPYEREWWHYQLADEPYPDTYWDFDITEDMFCQ
jgi:D-alanyl-D-alanine dipeptidase